MTEGAPETVFFADAAEFREWLETHGASADEVWVGFHRKRTGRARFTYPEAVDQALCFGWIDGVRRSIDEERYTNRFTPRRARSVWSAVNIKRARELMDQGLMRPAGHAAFERGTASRAAGYSHEQRGDVALPEEFERQLKANEDAWTFFQRQPASYRKAAIWWVVSAKQEETKRRRLGTLIADSAQGRTVPPLTRRTGPR
jgi:uncharacterized protein YdeI (YjbR/CyaY-like superfamily)